MNWYYEKDGVSQGPFPEPEILALAQRQQVQAQTLIWNPGLEDWSTLGTLKPEWLEQPNPEPTKKPAAKQTMPKTDGPLPSSEPVVKGQLPKPKAGLERDEGEKKVGLLGRLFGFGKKKL